MIINIIKAWYFFLKTYIDSKEFIETFSYIILLIIFKPLIINKKQQANNLEVL